MSTAAFGLTAAVFRTPPCSEHGQRWCANRRTSPAGEAWGVAECAPWDCATLFASASVTSTSDVWTSAFVTLALPQVSGPYGPWSHDVLTSPTLNVLPRIVA